MAVQSMNRDGQGLKFFDCSSIIQSSIEVRNIHVHKKGPVTCSLFPGYKGQEFNSCIIEEELQKELDKRMPNNYNKNYRKLLHLSRISMNVEITAKKLDKV